MAVLAFLKKLYIAKSPLERGSAQPDKQLDGIVEGHSRVAVFYGAQDSRQIFPGSSRISACPCGMPRTHAACQAVRRHAGIARNGRPHPVHASAKRTLFSSTAQQPIRSGCASNHWGPLSWSARSSRRFHSGAMGAVVSVVVMCCPTPRRALAARELRSFFCWTHNTTNCSH